MFSYDKESGFKLNVFNNQVKFCHSVKINHNNPPKPNYALFSFKFDLSKKNECDS